MIERPRFSQAEANTFHDRFFEEGTNITETDRWSVTAVYRGDNGNRFALYRCLPIEEPSGITSITVWRNSHPLWPFVTLRVFVATDESLEAFSKDTNRKHIRIPEPETCNEYMDELLAGAQKYAGRHHPDKHKSSYERALREAWRKGSITGAEFASPKHNIARGVRFSALP